MAIPYQGNPSPIDDELLSAYLDGELSPDERATVEATIAADAAVRARATELRATVALLGALPQPMPRRTFILTPEQAAAIRPVRMPWVIRLFPAVAAVGAVAAVLCLVLLGGDLATGGFATTQRQAVSSRPAVESVSAVAVPQATTAARPAPAAAAATTAALPAAPTSSLPRRRRECSRPRTRPAARRRAQCGQRSGGRARVADRHGGLYARRVTGEQRRLSSDHPDRARPDCGCPGAPDGGCQCAASTPTCQRPAARRRGRDEGDAPGAGRACAGGGNPPRAPRGRRADARHAWLAAAGIAPGTVGQATPLLRDGLWERNHHA